MGRSLIEINDAWRKRRTMELWDDFKNYTTAGLWTTTADGAATATVGSGAGGLLTLDSVDATTNRQVYVATTNAIFLIANARAMTCEALIQFSEAATNKANIGFGWCSSIAAGTFADSTGEMVSSYTGAVIYKVPGGTLWKVQSSVGAQPIAATVTNSTAGGTAYQRLSIDINPVSATIAEVTYSLNGNQLKDANNNKIKDQLTYTSALAMKLFVGCKCGSANEQTLIVDYIAAGHLRPTVL